MDSALSLYALTDQYLVAAERLADLGLDDQTVADTLEALAGPLEERATSIAMLARNLDASAAAIAEAEAKMAARRRRIEARAEHIRMYVKEQMERAGISKIESPHFVVCIKRNPPALVIDAPTQVPERFTRTPPIAPSSPDRKAIADAIKAGESIDFAHLQSSTRLAIE